MMTNRLYQKPRVFIDSDVLFAGAASPSENSASQLILRLSEISLFEGIVSKQVITEAERNLKAKLPQALPAFNHLVSRAIKVLPNPDESETQAFIGMADPKDIPILAAAVTHQCQWLVTFNLKHYQPGHPSLIIQNPGDFILSIRDLLSQL